MLSSHWVPIGLLIVFVIALLLTLCIGAIDWRRLHNVSTRLLRRSSPTTKADPLTLHIPSIAHFDQVYVCANV